jgi:hypothetical protein
MGLMGRVGRRNRRGELLRAEIVVMGQSRAEQDRWVAQIENGKKSVVV